MRPISFNYSTKDDCKMFLLVENAPAGAIKQGNIPYCLTVLISAALQSVYFVPLP